MWTTSNKNMNEFLRITLIKSKLTYLQEKVNMVQHMTVATQAAEFRTRQ